MLNLVTALWPFLILFMTPGEIRPAELPLESFYKATQMSRCVLFIHRIISGFLPREGWIFGMWMKGCSDDPGFSCYFSSGFEFQSQELYTIAEKENA